MKRSFIFLGLLIMGTFFVGFYLKKRFKKHASVSLSFSRILLSNSDVKEVCYLPNCSNITAVGDSLFLTSDNNSFPELAEHIDERPTIVTTKAKNVYEAGDELYFHDPGRNVFISNSSNKEKIQVVASEDDNAIATDSGIFYGVVRQKQGGAEYILKKCNSSLELNLSEHIAHLLKGVNSSCVFDYTEGQLLDLDSTSFIYLFTN